MQLFTINSVDYTSAVDQRTYSVQQEDVYTAWQDGNWKEHRVIARTKIAGSFNMTFLSKTAYDAFLADFAAARNAAGYYTTTLWVNSIAAAATVNAFLEIKTISRWTMEAFGGTPEVFSVSVKVTER